MWTPRTFRVDDLPTLHALIREHSFGLLVSQSEGRPLGTHLPFMIDPDRGPHGTLIAHMARANPHWKSWSEGTVVMAVFQGAHAYISPEWYKQKETVPTWNYATVHAYGVPRLIHDPDALRPMVEALVDLHETQAASNWDRGQMEAVMGVELQAIVGFEIPIDQIQGKYKFNQNRSAEDQSGVADALERSPNAIDRAVAAIMRENLRGQREA